MSRLPDSQPVTLWVNTKMQFCPHYGKGCGFASEDPEEIRNHILNVHREEVLAAQGKLDGGKLTEEEKRLAIIGALPNESVVCPFCFTRWESRATRFFNDADGKLSKMVRCKKDGGGCGRKMQEATMMWYNEPRTFGREVGGYKMFWKTVSEEGIGHDEWMKRLKQFYTNKVVMQQFWDGYGDARPEFAEKQKIKKMEREAEQAGQFK